MRIIQRPIECIRLIAFLAVAGNSCGQQADPGLAPQTEKSEVTTVVRFEIYPQRMAKTESFRADFLDAETGESVLLNYMVDGTPVIEMQPSIRGGQQSIRRKGLDGQSLILTVSPSRALGIGHVNSEAFVMHEGETPVLKLQFPEVGELEIEIHESVGGWELMSSVEGADELVICLTQMPRRGLTPGSEVTIVSCLDGPRDLRMPYNPKVLGDPPFARLINSENGIVFRVGFIAAGDWQLQLRDKDSEWMSRARKITVPVDAMVKFDVAKISQPIQIVLEFHEKWHGPNWNFQAWSRSGSSFLIPSGIEFDDVGSPFGKVRIPAESTELLISSAFIVEDEASWVEVAFRQFSLPNDKEGIPKKLVLSPEAKQTPSITLDPAETESGFCYLTLQKVHRQDETSMDFPLEGSTLLIPSLECKIFGLPKGEYRISRNEIEMPDMPIDQVFVNVE